MLARYEATDVPKLHSTSLNGFERENMDGVLVGGDDPIVNEKGQLVLRFRANLIAETFDVYEKTFLYLERIFEAKQARRTYKQKVVKLCARRSSCFKGDALMVTMGNHTWAAVTEKVQNHTDNIEATSNQKLADAEARDKGECLEFGVEVGKKTQRVIARADGL